MIDVRRREAETIINGHIEFLFSPEASGGQPEGQFIFPQGCTVKGTIIVNKTLYLDLKV